MEGDKKMVSKRTMTTSHAHRNARSSPIASYLAAYAASWVFTTRPPRRHRRSARIQFSFAYAPCLSGGRSIRTCGIDPAWAPALAVVPSERRAGAALPIREIQMDAPPVVLPLRLNVALCATGVQVMFDASKGSKYTIEAGGGLKKVCAPPKSPLAQRARGARPCVFYSKALAGAHLCCALTEPHLRGIDGGAGAVEVARQRDGCQE